MRCFYYRTLLSSNLSTLSSCARAGQFLNCVNSRRAIRGNLGIQMNYLNYYHNEYIDSSPYLSLLATQGPVVLHLLEYHCAFVSKSL
jgi:hypothetical protein